MYVDSDYFYSVYPDLLADNAYDKCCKQAQRLIDSQTTGIDGVRKLRIAMPTDAEDLDAVKLCWCEICKACYLIEKAKDALNSASGVQTINGSYASASIKSISAGGESISYGMDSNLESMYMTAAKSINGANTIASSIAREYLSGVKDANGVNILFRGAYPYV